MTDYSNWKVLRSVLNYRGDDEEKRAAAKAAQAEYEQVLDWCEKNPYWVIEDGEYYITASSEPTVEEMQAQVRAVRDNYLQDYDFTQLTDVPFTPEEKAEYAEYRQYLRDYTETPNWWLSNPKTFEEWKAGA